MEPKYLEGTAIIVEVLFEVLLYLWPSCYGGVLSSPYIDDTFYYY